MSNADRPRDLTPTEPYVLTPRPEGDVVVIELPADYTTREHELARKLAGDIRDARKTSPIVVVVPRQIRVYLASEQT